MKITKQFQFHQLTKKEKLSQWKSEKKFRSLTTSEYFSQKNSPTKKKKKLKKSKLNFIWIFFNFN